MELVSVLSETPVEEFGFACKTATSAAPFVERGHGFMRSPRRCAVRSYMIYSSQVDALPAALQRRIYRGIFDLIADDERQVVFQFLAIRIRIFPAVLCPGSECSSDQERL
jgi:hypothetical protein